MLIRKTMQQATGQLAAFAEDAAGLTLAQVGVRATALPPDVSGGGGARPPILAQEPPTITSGGPPGSSHDPTPWSRQLITGDSVPELSLMSFAHPGESLGSPPGAPTGSAHLATKRDIRQN